MTLRLANQSGGEQVGTVTKGLFQCHVPTPFRHFCVVAAEEDFRNNPAPIFGRASIVREIQHSAREVERLDELLYRSNGGQGTVSEFVNPFFHFRLVKRLIFAGCFVPQSAGKKPSHGIDDHHRRELSAAENEIANRNFFRSKMFRHPFIHTFVATANQNDALQLRVAARRLLPKEPSSGRHQNNRGFGIRGSFLPRVAEVVAQKRFSCLKQRFRLKNHPFATSEWPVVNGSVAVLGKFPQILNVNLNDAVLLSTAQNSVLERPSKELREYGDQIESHCLCQSNLLERFAVMLRAPVREFLGLILSF
jgi:hypothetical protein